MKSYKRYTIEKIFIFTISSILVFVSTGYHFKEGVSALSLKLTEIFFTPIFHSMFYNVFEIILLSFLVYMFIKSKLSLQNATKREIFIFMFAILCYILNMINPNSHSMNPIFGMPLFSNVTEYFFLFLLYIFFFIDKRKITYIILIFFKYIFILSLFRGLLIILLYSFGIGPIRFGRTITLLEYDVLMQYAILTVIFFTAFLLRKNLKMFALTLLFFLIIFLSTARSSLGPSVLAIIGILIVFLFKSTQIKGIKIIIGVGIFVILLASTFKYLPDPFKRTFYRVVALIPSQAETPFSEISSTGHWEQSLYTSSSILEKNIFWGAGYGSSQDIYIRGQSVGIHNAYAGLWAHFGLYLVIFYLSFLVLVISEFFKILKLHNKSFSSFYWYKLALCLYYIGYAITAYVGLHTVYTSFRSQFILVLIWTFIFRVKEKDFKYIMEGKIRK